jgi:hypothetical protein
MDCRIGPFNLFLIVHKKNIYLTVCDSARASATDPRFSFVRGRLVRRRAFIGLGEGDDLVGDGLPNVIGAVPDPHSDVR